MPGSLTFQCKEAIICVSCHNEPVNWPGEMLSPYNIHFYYSVIFSDFFVLNRHTPKILHFDLIAKRAAGLFWNGKHILTLCPGHFISGVTGPEYRRIAGLHYRCRDFITSRHTSSLQSVYLRLSHHLWRKREKKSAVWQWLMRRYTKKSPPLLRANRPVSNDKQWNNTIP